MCKKEHCILIGFSIIDLSKALMYDFHYEFINKKYGDKAKLLFTDTDSLLSNYSLLYKLLLSNYYY